MVMVVAIIRPDCLDEVKAALDDLGVMGISVSEIRGAGRQRGYVHTYRRSEYQVSLIEKARVEVVAADWEVEEIAAAIQEAQSASAPVLIRIETRAGHGAGKPTSKQIEEIADQYAFLVKNLGMKVKTQ